MPGRTTRTEIIAAAEHLFVEYGAASTLEEIAAEARISKGGLLYHFPSKEALRSTVCQEVVDRLWRAVHSLVAAEDDGRPGALLRAYVRALTGDSAEAARVFQPSALPQLFHETPGTTDVLHEDAERWRAAFAADGIERADCLVIRHSAEGAATAAGEGYIDGEELLIIRNRLLSMIDSTQLR